MRIRCMAGLVAAGLLACAWPAWAVGSGDPAAVRNEDGKYYDKDGNPLPAQIGSGTGSGFSRQLMTTDCSSQEAEFGVSVGGALYVVHLQCGCQ